MICPGQRTWSSRPPPQVDNRLVTTEAGDGQEPPSGSAELELVRARAGWADRWRSYQVLLDGVKVAKIRGGQTQVVPVEPGNHEVHLTIDWARSPSVDVDVGAGQRVRLKCWSNVRPFRTKRAMANPDAWIGLALDENRNQASED